MGDATVTGPWKQVVCADCGREYRCTPNDDHYLRAGDPEGSPRVCFACLVTPHNGRTPCPNGGDGCVDLPECDGNGWHDVPDIGRTR